MTPSGFIKSKQVIHRKLTRAYGFTHRGSAYVVPAGTRTTSLTASGPDDRYNFVDEFGWVPKLQYTDTNGAVREYMPGLDIHDFRHYGIHVPLEYCEEEVSV